MFFPGVVPGAASMSCPAHTSYLCPPSASFAADLNNADHHHRRGNFVSVNASFQMTRIESVHSSIVSPKQFRLRPRLHENQSLIFKPSILMFIIILWSMK